MKKNLVILGLVLVVILAINYFFQSYYFPGSTIDGQDVSFKPREIEHIESIKGSFELTSNSVTMNYKLLSDSMSYSYYRPPIEFFSLKPLKFSSTKSLVYSQDRLKEEIGEVYKTLPENRPSEDANLSLEKGELILKPQKIGYNFPSQEELFEIISSALEKDNFSLDLDQYVEEPAILTRDLRSNYKALESYSLTNQDYDWTLEGEELFALFNDDFTVNKKKAQQAMEKYFTEADTWNTMWKVDQEESLPSFLEALEKRKKTWEVSYSRVKRSHGGNTLNNGIAVSIAKQWLWVFVNGQEVFQAPIITGNPNRGYPTHRGYWYILEKDTNTRLANTNREGESYDVAVRYWMQFNYEGMIEGFHDADWQWAFGSDAYLWNGSHGCVNVAPMDMPTLYSLSWVGMTVWVY